MDERGPVREADADLASLEILAVVWPGNAATIVASLAMVPRALEATEILAGEGVEPKVFDLRILRPINIGPIAESLARAGRLVTVEEQHRLDGWGAQAVAELVEQGPGVFKAPPRRITLPEHPLPSVRRWRMPRFRMLIGSPMSSARSCEFTSNDGVAVD